MARTVVGYIGAGGLNNMASSSPTGMVEALTGLPISSGLEVGQFQEFGSGDAKKYSYQVNGAFPSLQLYDGTYMWVALDPAVSTDPIPMGTALAWLASVEGSTPGVPTVTTLNTTTNADFAGISIDSNFGKSHPYAFIQLDGKASALFDSGVPTAFGDVISLSTGTQGSVTRTGASNAAWNGLSLGLSLATTGTSGVRGIIRIIRKQTRY